MSVQKIQMNVSIDTICPIVVNTSEAILTFQTASAVATANNVNSKFSSCQPTDYDFLQVWTSNQVNTCCSNTVGVQQNKTNVMGYGY